ncbi:MAG: riboflavin biosynthesis protein RibF [Paludibacteraceae bacterium]|nr:riboflavin biosynthesis protein RibF [Paludibacteraceae bacterium]
MSYAATIGFFDGVHQGHRFLLDSLCQVAHTHSLATMAVTFTEHPQTVLHGTAPHLLTSLDERISLLKKAGVDEVTVLDFSAIHNLQAQAFMLWLKQRYNVTLLLMGYDHRFGSDHINNISDYQRLGQEIDVEVVLAPPMPNRQVSSSVVRQAVSDGRIEEADSLLGRAYTLTGIVTHGKGLGKTIGFPTANISLTDTRRLLPKDGVYAVTVDNGTTMSAKWAVANIGTNPTVGGEERTIEVHILGFQGSLYGSTLTLRFLYRLRNEQTFTSIEALKQQIGRDIQSLRTKM